jgi:ribosomal-protein-alanine N-acetyltransferase
MHPIDLAPGIILRTVEETDAEALAAAYDRNREHLGPWDRRRDEEFFTAECQRRLIRRQLEEQEAGRLVRFVLEDGEGILGNATLSNIVFGAYRNASIGYWIDRDHLGRGLATAAVEALCQYSDQELSLHRLEAGTLVHNVRSQRVLGKCGFEYVGLAREYVHIDGRWQDHRLFQKILNDRDA